MQVDNRNYLNQRRPAHDSRSEPHKNGAAHAVKALDPRHIDERAIDPDEEPSRDAHHGSIHERGPDPGEDHHRGPVEGGDPHVVGVATLCVRRGGNVSYTGT